MTRILGLDIGRNSIGWAIQNNETNNIDSWGVHIFEGAIPSGRAKNRARHRIMHRRKMETETGATWRAREMVAKNPSISAAGFGAFLFLLLSLIDFKDWQYWLNLAITALLTLLSILPKKTN